VWRGYCVSHVASVHPRITKAQRESGVIAILLASVLDGGGWSSPRSGRFTPGKDPVPIVQEVGWASEPVWTGAENLAPHRVSIPRPSLYRLPRG
jgi:hypothetical protein